MGYKIPFGKPFTITIMFIFLENGGRFSMDVGPFNKAIARLT